MLGPYVQLQERWQASLLTVCLIVVWVSRAGVPHAVGDPPLAQSGMVLPLVAWTHGLTTSWVAGPISGFTKRYSMGWGFNQSFTPPPFPFFFFALASGHKKNKTH